MHPVRVGFVLAVLLALLPSPARAEASLKLLDSPVVAGRTARLRVVIPGGIQAPLRAVAGIGQVGPFARVGPDTFEADYVVSQGVGPAQSEIVVFEDRVGGALTYALANIQDTVSLKGKSHPRVPTFARAGPKRVGPFHPDAKGEVEVSVPVNGEVSEVELETAQGKPLGKIAVKPTLIKTVAIGRPSRVHAGDATPLEVLLVVPYERAFKFEAPRAQASAGFVALDLKGSPDEAIRYTVAPPQGGAMPITVKLTDSFGKVVGSATFMDAGPRAAHLAMQLPDEPLAPGQRANILLQVTDDRGEAAEGMLELNVSAGQVSPPLERGAGNYEVAFTAPSTAASGVHVTAKLLGEKVQAEGDLKLRGGRAAKVVFKPEGEARAGEVLSVEVQVLDAAGNPAQPDGLSVAADHGEIAALKDRGGGKFVVDVRAPADASAVQLSARDGTTELTGHQTIDLAPASGLPTALLGVHGGFSNNFGKLSTPTISATGQFLVGPTAGSIGSGVGLLAGYLPQTTQTLVSDQSTSGTLQLSRIALLARAGGFGALGDLGLYGGLQGGVEKLSGSLISLGRAPLSLDSWRPAFGAYGGAGYKVGPGYVALEVRATYASVDIQSDVIRVKGPVGGVDGALGYLFAL